MSMETKAGADIKYIYRSHFACACVCARPSLHTCTEPRLARVPVWTDERERETGCRSIATFLSRTKVSNVPGVASSRFPAILLSSCKKKNNVAKRIRVFLLNLRLLLLEMQNRVNRLLLAMLNTSALIHSQFSINACEAKMQIKRLLLRETFI